MTHFRIADSEALAVFVRYANSVGASVTVLSLNEKFVATTDIPVEVTNTTNLDPFNQCFYTDNHRSYWQEIVEVSEDAYRFVTQT